MTTAITETYEDYSLMFQRSAGQHWNEAGTQPMGQWAWEPQTDTESIIRWGVPNSWPPTYGEHFIRDGDWVLLKGWEDNGTFYSLDVHLQWEADADYVSNKKPLPPGAQRYVKWHTADGESYSLYAQGTITEQVSGKQIAFAHEQQWYNHRSTVGNPNVRDVPALRQVERWWDDNHHPFGLRLHRAVYLGRGYGMAYKTVNRDPASGAATFTTYLKHAWSY